MFFIASKIFWWTAQPLHGLLLAQAAGLVLVAARWRRTGLTLITLTTVTMLTIMLTPVADIALHGLEHAVARPQLPPRLDGIVVLGGAERAGLTEDYGMVDLNDDSERMTEFAALARRYPHARLVYTGGSGSLSPEAVSHGEVIRRFFRDEGLDASRLVIEEQSRNTYENAVLTRALVQPHAGEHWLLVTSAFHMPRALAVFNKAGWAVLPYPVGYFTRSQISLVPDGDGLEQFNKLHRALHEWIGLLAYSLTGKT